jgi:maleylacetoacetate isomerase
MAILEYLEERYPHPPLLPGTSLEKARVRAFCHTIVADIHPLNNLRVLTYLTDTLYITDEQKQAWYETWIHKGFAALETMLSGKDPFCFGQKITLAEVCLIPQVYNALRFNCSLAPYPRIQAIYDHCITLPAFLEASPENQVDAPI